MLSGEDDAAGGAMLVRRRQRWSGELVVHSVDAVAEVVWWRWRELLLLHGEWRRRWRRQRQRQRVGVARLVWLVLMERRRRREWLGHRRARRLLRWTRRRLQVGVLCRARRRLERRWREPDRLGGALGERRGGVSAAARRRCRWRRLELAVPGVEHELHPRGITERRRRRRAVVGDRLLEDRLGLLPNHRARRHGPGQRQRRAVAAGGPGPERGRLHEAKLGALLRRRRCSVGGEVAVRLDAAEVVVGRDLAEHGGVGARVLERDVGVGLEPVDDAAHVGLPVDADAVDVERPEPREPRLEGGHRWQRGLRRELHHQRRRRWRLDRRSQSRLLLLLPGSDRIILPRRRRRRGGELQTGGLLVSGERLDLVELGFLLGGKLLLAIRRGALDAGNLGGGGGGVAGPRGRLLLRRRLLAVGGGGGIGLRGLVVLGWIVLMALLERLGAEGEEEGASFVRDAAAAGDIGGNERKALKLGYYLLQIMVYLSRQ
ncbi:hypothetical protein EE612_027114 [Oryza sativa]|nr:hypothetical protein EE612_027114 [Oryza sativa]